MTNEIAVFNKAVINKLVFEDFEEQKKVFGDATPGIDEMVLKLPRAFINHYESNEILKVMMHNMRYDPRKGSLSIGYDLIEKRIIECVRAAFDKLPSKINTVYLVGGFGGCRFVRQKIEEAIAQHCGILYDNIVCPQYPGLAVVSGAVMWRKDPNIIQSRVADATYGIAGGPIFNPSIHDEHYKFVDEDGVLRCDNVLCVYVLKGETIKDYVYKITYIPHSQWSTQAHITIYCTTDDGVQYVRDKKGKVTVRKIGELIFDIPNPENIPRNERAYDVFMDFSGTEIQARAQYTITGEEVKTCNA
uniref:Hsp70 family protein n=1 Tax=Amphimedon queenslandica TaxID=400682 RepID=A0A1X7TKN3_AMPQE